MRNTLLLTIYTLLLYFSSCISVSYAQVGIGTTSPKGALDLDSGIYGLVLPRVELTKTTLAAPVINPNGGSLAVGTVVYNTNTTFSGSYDVSPGIYMWNGVDWINEFPKKHAQIFKQTSYIRTRSNAGYENIPGLTNNIIFTARYTGTYKIEVSANYGGGYVRNLAGGETNPLVQSGNFKFTFDITGANVDHIFPIKTYSVYGNIQYYLIWEQATIILYEQLTAGQDYYIALRFDQDDSNGFVNSGNSSTGRGYIGYDIPCSVEFTYLD